MGGGYWLRRVGVMVMGICLVLVVLPGSADAATGRTASTRRLLNDLGRGVEHTAGYARSRFGDWTDADHDGCDTRDEVLIQEAVVRPRVRSGCTLRGGRWYSRYDGARTRNPSSFDIDHLVPLNEAWQSGAWKWTAGTRKAYANDLGYRTSLIAVSASSNRSKGDREPQQWMPPRAAFGCTYVARWVAVKWRWRLKVNVAERAFLRHELEACGWPRVRRPARPVISGTSDGDSANSGGTSTGGTSPDSATDPRFSYCYQVIDAGYGPYVQGRDVEYDWYTDGDGDGVVCET